ncbi:hypothetical protein ACFL2H_06335 [Planctomycetota bacterium]
MMKSSCIIRPGTVTADPSTLETAEIQSNSEVWIPENNTTPTIECETSNGVVESITVRCGCGCVTELVCEYS